MAPVSGRRLDSRFPTRPPGRSDRDAAREPACPIPRPVVTDFEGGSALSDFRARQLLPRLQAVEPRIEGLARPLRAPGRHRRTRSTRAERERFAALLTYGEPFDGAGQGRADVVVTPRLGTVSPWASKATDIAHNCGLALRRIERVTEYHLALKAPLLGKAPTLDGEQLAAVAALLHDRMTESVLRRARPGRAPVRRAAGRSRWRTSTCWRGGRAALEAANTQLRPGAGRRRDRLPGRRLHAAWAATRPTSS